MNWRAFIGPYEVSDGGQIRHAISRRIRKPKRLPPWGYLQVSLYVDGKFVYYYVHRAVLEAFIGPCPEGMQARHLNGDREDNRLENLAWGTPKENAADTEHHGRIARGGRLPHTRLTEDQVREIMASPETTTELARRLGVSRETVGRTRRGQNWSWLTGVIARA